MRPLWCDHVAVQDEEVDIAELLLNSRQAAIGASVMLCASAIWNAMALPFLTGWKSKSSRTTSSVSAK